MLSKNRPNVYLHYLEKSFYLRSRTALKWFIQSLFKKEGFEVKLLNYVFCTDQYLMKINKKFLNHDTYTDIITFQYTKGTEPVLADIYISIERVKENAKTYGVPFKKELYRVLFHGALHICGYKDKTEKDIKLMRSKEEYYLKQYVSRETKR